MRISCLLNVDEVGWIFEDFYIDRSSWAERIYWQGGVQYAPAYIVPLKEVPDEEA